MYMSAVIPVFQIIKDLFTLKSVKTKSQEYKENKWTQTQSRSMSFFASVSASTCFIYALASAFLLSV